MMRRNEQQVQAVQVCNGGDWPSVEEQQAYWRDKDIGGNVLPDRVQANHDTYQERSLPF